MGLLGSQVGGILGGAVGQRYGGNVGGQIGRAVGTAAGAAFPYFKKGGAVKRTGPAVVHAGEYVLPKGVKPTKAQKAAVAKLHKKK
jgi:hypothetical protein